MARGTVAALAFVGLGSLQETRWPEAFRSADSSRTRVEVLYGAGDLPGALQEALAGLRARPDDPVLLRRAGQLALALRLPDVATRSASALGAAVAVMPSSDDATRAWWTKEATALSRDTADLEARERELDTDVSRARVVSLAGLAAVLAALFALARGR
ncbi:MAG TPA: hypothetical protein VGR31_10745 [Planctomycetota bacterium]|nr:hypothetical protein [Planctomycetota bacterium]